MKSLKDILLDIATHGGIHIIRLAVAFFVAWMVSIPMIALATAERGHPDAYGGEWMLIIAAFVITYYIATKKIRLPVPKFEEERGNE